jgi:ribonuclease P protein component
MPKVSVVVGKKVAKSAVRRNALRRRVYAQLKNLIETTGYKGVLIIIVKPSYNAVPRKNSITALTKAVTEVFTKLTS